MKRGNTPGVRAARCALSVVVLFVAGCGATSNSPSTHPSSQTAADASTATAPTSPFRVALITEQSGPFAVFGAPYLHGLQAAAKLINSDGGIMGHQVVIKVMDDESLPTRAVSLAQGIEAAGVHYNMVASDLSGFTQAITPLLISYDAFQTTASPDPAVVKPAFPQLFGLSPQATAQEGAIVDQLVHRHITRVAIAAPDTSGARANVNAFLPLARQAGIATTVSYIPQGTVDATPQLQALQSGSPGALVIDGFGPQDQAILAARAKLTWSVPVYCDFACSATPWGSVPSGDRIGVNVEELPYVVQANSATRTPTWTRMHEFLARYEKQYPLGIIVDIEAYDMLMVARAAAMDAHSVDGDAIVKAADGLSTSAAVPGYIGGKLLFTPSNHIPGFVPGDFLFVRAAPPVQGLIPG